MSIAIFTLTSELHQEAQVIRDTQTFFDGMKLDFTWCHDDFSTYGSHPLEIIFVRTGGTEGLFLRLLPMLRELGFSIPEQKLASGIKQETIGSHAIIYTVKVQPTKRNLRDYIHPISAYGTHLTTLKVVYMPGTHDAQDLANMLTNLDLN